MENKYEINIESLEDGDAQIAFYIDDEEVKFEDMENKHQKIISKAISSISSILAEITYRDNHKYLS